MDISTLQIDFLFFYKKSICLKVLIPSAVGGDYNPRVAGFLPALEKIPAPLC